MVTADTLISMSDGSYLPIHLVRLNQLVKSHEDIVHDSLVKSIGASSLQNCPLVTINLSNGKSVTCSVGIKFFIKGEGWIESDYLRYGMEFITDDNSIVTLDSFEYSEEDEIDLYNLISVNPFPNFFCNGVLVHNGYFLTKGTNISKVNTSDLIESNVNHTDVISYDNTTKSIWVSPDKSIKTLYVIKMIGNPMALIGTGANQYFYVTNKSKWVRADELQIGDALKLQGDDEMLIKDVEILDNNIDEVYSINSTDVDTAFYANGFLTTTNNTIEI